MKKVLLTLVFAATSFLASSQVIRVGLGGNQPLGESRETGGLALGGELAYAPQPKLDFGVHLGIGLGVSDDGGELGLRYGIHSRYYFLTGAVKPYAGLMATMFTGGAIDVNSPIPTGSKKTNIGATPMVGLRLGPLNLNAGYTIGGGNFKGLNAGFGLLFGFGSFKD